MVVYFIFSLVKTGLFVVLVNDYFKRNYPTIYQDILIQCSFTVIYAYSKCQIYFNNLQNFINANPNLVYIINKYQNREKNIEFIYNNHAVLKTDNLELLNNISNLKLPQKFDFVIFSEDNSNPNMKNIVNKLIIYFLPNEPQHFSCESSNIKFILSEIFVNNDRIKIDFLQNTDNYYIVNNIIDNKFMQYFLYKYYNKELVGLNINNINDYDYTLDIIDHNVNKISINLKTNKIKIEKDSYEILKD